MKKHTWLLLAFSLTLTGCETMDAMTSWMSDDEEEAEAAVETQEQEQYVTLNVQNRWGFRIKEPMGARTTGGSCAVWTDTEKDYKGSCCWNERSECSCPCPEREE